MELAVVLNIMLYPVIGFMGFILKRMYDKIDNSMTEREVRIVIDDKLAPVQVQYIAIQEHLVRIEKELAQLRYELRRNGKEN